MKNLFLFILITALVQWSPGFCVETICSTDHQRLEYSLHELLKTLPDTYASPIQAALTALAPKQHIETIRFSPLLGGLSTARLFKTEIDGKKCVLRLLDPARAFERRQSEIAGLRIGAKLKIAPECLYADEAALVIIVQFIEGRTFSHNDLSDKKLVKKVMQAVRTFHDYTGEEHLIQHQVQKVDTIQSRRERCLKEGAIYPSCYDSLFSNLKDRFSQVGTKKVPVHGDLNPENIIVGQDGRIYLIDWAEACMESSSLDIGWFSCFSGASKKQIRTLLREYCGREPTKAELQGTFLFKDFTSLFLATAWIGRQEERDQDTLDTLLKNPLEKGSDYVKRGITTKMMTTASGRELTNYALGWLKEFIEDQQP